MARAPVFSVAFFLLLGLLVATAGQMTIQTTPVVMTDSTCETPSETFEGLCTITRECALACKSEGFENGHCGGRFRPRCYCTKPC
ncbi:hypothetical protein Taro_037065 [Colocasia esculenta]|uniref:Knottins-like domain-containing protein n=1 Tax=Colocasia esculenta TaxID=4460 RepID=A0A843WNK3_COLES|nr:hypothetical protein [Colocasia esculenta]